jgi:hypothetical protein
MRQHGKGFGEAMKKFLALLCGIASFGLGPVSAQTVTQAPAPTALVCAYNSAVPTPTSGSFFYVQCDSTGRLITNNQIVINTTAISGGTSGKVLYDNSATVGEANLWIESANSVALRNSTTAQSFKLYRTYTDASNYERVALDADNAAAGLTGFSLFAEQAGTGAARGMWLGTTGSAALSFVTNNAAKWAIQSGGSLTANTDNGYDIGLCISSGRPRHIYVGSNVYATAFVMARSGTSYASLQDDGDGNIRMYNGAASSFGLLKFGGTTTSFPALKRSSATLQARLADDSAYADFAASILTSNETAAVIRSNAAVTNLNGANTGTLTNSPVTGNPSYWFPVYINGNRYAVPAWLF